MIKSLLNSCLSRGMRQTIFSLINSETLSVCGEFMNPCCYTYKSLKYGELIVSLLMNLSFNPPADANVFF